MRTPQTYAALATALARTSGGAGGGARVDRLALRRVGELLIALLQSGGAYDSQAVRSELRRAGLPAAVSRAMAASPHTADELASVLSLLQV